MKQGRTFEALTAEVKRQLTTKRDFVAPAKALKVSPNASAIVLGNDVMGITRTGHDQLSAFTKIPREYYNRMLVEQPALAAQSLNTWLESLGDQRRMIRTLDGQVRAFKSPKFRRLDNADMMTMFCEELDAQKGELQVESCELTDSRLYLKARKPTLRHVVMEGRKVKDTSGMKVDDVIEAAVVISNSEIGAGSIKVEPMLFRLACLNGMVAGYALKKFHIGRQLPTEEDDNVREVLSDETRAAEDRTFWLKARDVLRAALNEDVFKDECERIEKAANDALPVGNNGVQATIANLVELLELPESLASVAVNNLALTGDATRWGAINAVTQCANGCDDYELATNIERAGGLILEITDRDWRRLAA